MINPTGYLFHKLITNTLGHESSIATRGIKEVVAIEPGDPRETWCETLCVSSQGIIYINTAFWAKWIQTELDATVVLFHELFHVVLGDTSKRVAKEDKDLANFTQDARINAGVLQLLESKHQIRGWSTTFLEKMYTSPDTLLLSPKRVSSRSKFAKLHQALYPHNYGVSYNYQDPNILGEEGIRNTVKLLIPKKRLKKITYLGSHNGTGEEGSKKPAEATFKEGAKETLATDMLSAMPKAGFGTLILNTLIRVIENNRIIRTHVLRQFSINSKLNKIAQLIDEEETVTDVLPIRPSKSDLALVASGYIPVFWHNYDEAKSSDLGGGLAVYLDVSGSVMEDLPVIIGLLKRLKKNIQTIFCFSNKVVEKSLSDLIQGNIDTTGGTDFDCIVEHAVKNEYSKVILFTDGWASISAENQTLAKRNIKDAAVILFGSGADRNNWISSHYKKSFNLQELLK